MGWVDTTKSDLPTSLRKSAPWQWKIFHLVRWFPQRTKPPWLWRFSIAIFDDRRVNRCKSTKSPRCPRCCEVHTHRDHHWGQRGAFLSSFRVFSKKIWRNSTSKKTFAGLPLSICGGGETLFQPALFLVEREECVNSTDEKKPWEQTCP